MNVPREPIAKIPADVAILALDAVLPNFTPDFGLGQGHKGRTESRLGPSPTNQPTTTKSANTSSFFFKRYFAAKGKMYRSQIEKMVNSERHGCDQTGPKGLGELNSIHLVRRTDKLSDFKTQ